VAGEGNEGGGISMFWVVDCFKCRGKEEEDHHSRNLRRKIEVGRMRLRDDDNKGRIRVLRSVIGDLDRDAFPATSFVGGGGAYMSAYTVSVPWRGEVHHRPASIGSFSAPSTEIKDYNSLSCQRDIVDAIPEWQYTTQH